MDELETMVNIFQYFDYQEYLRDYYIKRKEENYFFSYRFMGKQINLDPGFLVKVLQGKIHIAKKTIPDIIKLCKLNEKEAEYFENLVLFCKTKSQSETKRLFKILLDLRGMVAAEIEPQQYEFYQKWYHTAIRAVIGIDGFTGDYKKLAHRLSPKITIKEAKESIILLERLGFIVQNSEGVYEIATKSITTGSQWKSLAIRLFQEDTIQLAKESLERHHKDIRDISTMTVAIAPEDIEEIRQLAQEFRNSILQIKGSKEKASSVYQVNVQIFPLTEM